MFSIHRCTVRVMAVENTMSHIINGRHKGTVQLIQVLHLI
jgi:hypothetical protein